MNDEKPNIVYGRLLEAAHISGYTFRRLSDELEWLLDDDRWMQVGNGYTDPNDFYASIDLSPFNMDADERRPLVRKMAAIQKAHGARNNSAIARAAGVDEGTVRNDLRDPSERSESRRRDQHDLTRHSEPSEWFDRSAENVADLSRQATKRAEAEARREEQREANRALIDGLSPPDGKVRTIVIDPPWDWADEEDGAGSFGRTRPVYETIPIDDLETFKLGDEVPISELAEDDAHIYLWITNRSLPKGFRLLEAWGFRYVTCLTWVKPSFGMGLYFRGQTEHVLFGVRGSQPLLRADVATVFNADRGGDDHSAKPDEFYRLVETCSPGPWIDVFARRERPGWLVWGAEVA